MVNCLWGVIFIEYWKRQEVDLSCRWQTKGVSAVRPKRREFKPEKEVRDEGTAEMKGIFPVWKRMVRQLLQVPFVALAAVALGVIIATCFAIEIFISEIYSGPFKTYLVGLLPGVLMDTNNSGLHSYYLALIFGPDYERRSGHDCDETQRLRELRNPACVRHGIDTENLRY